MSKEISGRKGRFKALWIVLGIVLAAAVLAAIGWLLLKPRGTRPRLGEDDFRIGVEGDQMTLTWAAPVDADALRIFEWHADEKKYVLYGEYAVNSTVLSGVRDGEALELKLQAVRYTTNLLGQACESLSRSEEVTVIPVELDRPVLQKQAKPEEKSMTVSWDADEGNSYEFYLLDEQGQWQLFAEAQGGVLDLNFMPERGKPVSLAARAIRSGDGCVYYGSMSEPVEVDREEMLGTDPALTWEAAGENAYTLRWQETKGDLCELQQWSDREDAWISLGVYDWSLETVYETGRMPSSRELRFRVIAYDSEQQRDEEVFAAGPSEINFRTDTSATYCTVWPVVALDLFEAAQSDVVLDSVPAGAALCVLGEENDRFSVRYQGTYGYVDARYCMINLPEYLGDLCEYNITNSYDSIFRVHEYDIPEITGTVIQGYESVCLENDDLLVPYLYPCADRLKQAAEQVLEDGYCLRIYDAFRPNEATRYLYDTVSELLNTSVPTEEEEDGEPAAVKEETEEETLSRYEKATRAKREKAERAKQKQEAFADPGSTDVGSEGTTGTEGLGDGMTEGPEEGLEAGLEKNLPEGQEEAWIAALTAGLAQAKAAGLIPETQDEQTQGISLEDFLMSLTPEQLEIFAAGGYVEGMENIILEEAGPTYQDVMTNGTFRLSAFLAAVTSAHNRGIALDLTLVDKETDEALPMQSEMHDLSWNSILSLNNENADLLSEYMLGVGFRGLTSEWWHFQDDETREALELNSYLAKGVSVTGWKKDDTGWRYRQEDGSFLKNATATVEGKSCTFDENGYVKE